MSARTKYVVYSVLSTLAALVITASCAGAQQPAPMRHAAIATHAIARGAVLTADDIVYRDTVLRATPDTNHVAPGWITRRTIMAGEVLHTPAVSPPAAVQANEEVNVEWTDENITLRLRGMCMRTAAVGERVPVRTEHGRRLEAVVVGPGRVRID